MSVNDKNSIVNLKTEKAGMKKLLHRFHSKTWSRSGFHKC